MKSKRVYLLFSVFGGICFVIGLARADPKPVAEDGPFSCIITTDEVFKPYTLGKSINVYVDFQHQLEDDLILTDVLKQSNVFSFSIEDEQGNQISMRQHLTNDKDFTYSRIEPRRKVGTCIDIANWYKILDAGTYTLQAKWQIDTGQQIYSGKSNITHIKVVSPQDKYVFDLVLSAVQASSMTRYVPAYYKLVEIGPRAAPILLEWLRMREKGQIPTDKLYENDILLDIFSHIGTTEAHEVITNYNGIDERRRAILLKRVEIWQSGNRYERLIEAFKDSRISKKWVIFKLGVLEDKRAIPVLGEIVQNDKSLDIRETAKDALAHLNNPDIPMRYITHKRSVRIELKPTKQEYRLGEPIEIHCKLIAGEYGSYEIAEFSKPLLHFLPWGRRSEPFCLTMKKARRIGTPPPFGLPGSGFPGIGLLPGSPTQTELPKGITRYGRLIPVKELVWTKRILADRDEEPLEGYLNANDLQPNGSFTLRPGESREYIVRDLSSAFKITEPGEYEIHDFIFYRKMLTRSNRITITILPAE